MHDSLLLDINIEHFCDDVNRATSAADGWDWGVEWAYNLGRQSIITGHSIDGMTAQMVMYR